jgi:AcrR family transcriptional regulator
MATRDRILQAALSCFAERGFDGTSVRQIAVRAGVSLGLLYHYFPGKEAVLVELFQRSAELIQGCFAEAMGVPDPRERLRVLVRVSVRVMAEQAEFYRLSLSVRAQPAVLGALADSIGALHEALHQQFVAWLSEAGVHEPELRARLLVASLDGVCQRLCLEPTTYPGEAVGELILSDLLDEPPSHCGAGEREER